MKTSEGKHSTNYFNAFIEVAEDCPVAQAEVPQSRGENKTVAQLQFERVVQHPYTYTSDEVIFGIFAERNDVSASEFETEKEKFFSKGQACLRSSPLGKRYGWGFHFDEEGRVAAYPRESKEYESFTKDPKLQHTKAMRSRRG